MTTERVTQCPHCKATFKVSDEQLAVANGRVRCGACMNIFDALAYAQTPPHTSPDKQPSPEQKTPAQSTPALATKQSLEDETLRQEVFKNPDGRESSNASPAELEDEFGESNSSLNANDGILIQDDPEQDKSEDGYAKGMMSDELSTSFLELDDNSSSSDPYKTTSHFEDDNFDGSNDEFWAEKMLSDDDDHGRIEPHISSNDVPRQSPSAIEKQNAQHIREEMEAYEENPGLDENDDDFESLHFQYEQDPKPKKRHWFWSITLILFNLCLALVLLAQVGWFHYEKLAHFPIAVTTYEKGCELLGCTVPELEDLSLVKSNNLVVRSHPTNHKALIIDAIIINEADFAQPFPDIALYFSDINGKTVAQRRIAPAEYLSQELLNWEKMPANQAIHISLELIDPGREAVNYSLKFFKSENPAKDQNTGQLSTNQDKI